MVIGVSLGVSLLCLLGCVLGSIRVSNALVLCFRSWLSSLVSLYFLFRSFMSCVMVSVLCLCFFSCFSRRTSSVSRFTYSSMLVHFSCSFARLFRSSVLSSCSCFLVDVSWGVVLVLLSVLSLLGFLVVFSVVSCSILSLR